MNPESRKVHISMSSSLKNETKDDKHSFLLYENLVENEIEVWESNLEVMRIILLKTKTTTFSFDLIISLEIVHEPSFHPLESVDPLHSSLFGENFPISN
jgi:hypothetical protein